MLQQFKLCVYADWRIKSERLWLRVAPCFGITIPKSVLADVSIRAQHGRFMQTFSGILFLKCVEIPVNLGLV